MNVDKINILSLLIIMKLANGGLYTKDDNVNLLDSDNFYDLVLEKEHAWMIQFYNTWCGHCQYFAPLYKKLALDIRGWKHTVKPGVLDCAEDKNSAICRDYEVIGYPTVEVFGAFVKKGNIGIPMPYQLATGDTEKIEEFLLTTLTEKQASRNGSESWSNLQYFKGNISNIMTNAPVSSQKTFVIYEPKNSIVGRQVILDLQFMKHVRLMRMKKESVSLALLLPDGQLTTLDTKDGSRGQLKEAIAKALRLGIGDMNEISTKGKEIDSDDHSLNNERDRLQGGSGEGDQVYLIDIENALSYVFRHEFTLRKVIEGQDLLALKDFVQVLYFCLPARSHVHQFLEKFYFYVTNKISIRGENLSAVYNSLTSDISSLPRQQPWVGCLGSEPKYRGFPCGLWTMFHVLTVNPCSADGSWHVMKPLEVLEGIHGFVKHYFSCRDCSQHFQQMFAADALDYVDDGDDGISWLWKSHNRVNHRLRKDLSEDPFHPKRPFPNRLNCPQCWADSDRFNEEEVVIYLKKTYGWGAISRARLDEDEPAALQLYKMTASIGSYLSYYGWYAFGALYMLSSALLIICFLYTIAKYRPKSNCRYRYHVL